MGSLGRTGSTQGHDDLVEYDDSRRGATHPKDMRFRKCDPWSPYKSKDTQPKEDTKKVKARDMEV
jgi:hypothetical protein